MVRSGVFTRIAGGVAILLLIASFSPTLSAHGPGDEILPQIGVDERLGGSVPLDLPLRNEAGEEVRLRDYFTGGPVILTLNYYTCPMLCPVVFRNLAAAIDRLPGLSLGREFRIVTVSIDEREALSQARAKGGESRAMVHKVRATQGSWPFLVGSKEGISRLAASVGVRYARVGANDFAHPNVMVVLTPDGRVARYLYGIDPAPRDLGLALVEAAGGRIGGSPIVNRALLYCYHYDPVGKRYTLAATNIMKIGGGGVLLLLGTMLLVLWRRERSGRGAKGTGG
jgi:protein SCO1/2